MNKAKKEIEKSIASKKMYTVTNNVRSIINSAIVNCKKGDIIELTDFEASILHAYVEEVTCR